MRLSGQFQACLFFYEKISRAQKSLKRKTNDFYPLRREKLLPLLFSVCLICFFGLLLVIVCARNLFVKKKKINRLEIVQIASFYNTTIIDGTYIHTYIHTLLLLIISVYLSIYLSIYPSIYASTFLCFFFL